MILSFLVNRCEFARPKLYNGRHEFTFGSIACLAWFIAIYIKLSFEEPESWTNTEKIIEAFSFIGFAGIPIFFLATPTGARFAQKVLVKRHGLWFQISLCALLSIYIASIKLLGLNPDHFTWLKQVNNLIFNNNFWLNSVLFITSTFFALRMPFLLLNLRNPIQPQKLSYRLQVLACLLCNIVYLLASHTSLISPLFQSEYTEGYYISLAYLLILFAMNLPFCKHPALNQRLVLFDFFLILICVSILFWFSLPFFSFGVFIGVNLFIVVVIYGTGLGREHFGYSFQPQVKDLSYLCKLVLLAFLVLTPIALLSGFVNPSNQTTKLSLLRLGIYFILFSLRVGVFEEVLFRSGVMVFVRDQLQNYYPHTLQPRQLVLTSAIIGSVIFGICHAGNQPGAGSALSPIEYKLTYIFLASLASLFYSLALGETNRLWVSVTIHGFVDTVAVVLLGSFLTAPF